MFTLYLGSLRGILSPRRTCTLTGETALGVDTFVTAREQGTVTQRSERKDVYLGRKLGQLDRPTQRDGGKRRLRP